MKKTTLYIDIEDDIASIVEKVSNAPEKIVALVLPKRPGVLQSSVNVRLLKRSGEETSKNLVLITNDEQVMRLAGQTGLFVSSSLQSKPAIPAFDDVQDTDVDEISDNASANSDAVDPAQPEVYKDDTIIDPHTPVGDLVDDKEEDIELDNTEVADEVADVAKESKKSKIKKISVPSFSKFRTKLTAGVLATILLGSGLFWALVIAPKASVMLTTARSEVNTKILFTAGVANSAVDLEQALVPAVSKIDVQKLTGTFVASGSKDAGEKARGTITLRNCDSTDSLTIPSGTGVSRGAYTFITQATVTLEGGNFTGGGSVCTTPASEEEDVLVVATQAGDQYNLAAGNYTVAGFESVRASGDAMGGGTTKIVKVVTESDVETAKQLVLDKAADNVKGKVAQLLVDENLVPIQETFTTEQGVPVPSVAVGGEATGDVTLNIDLTSTMLGVKTVDIEPFVTRELAKTIDASKQKVYDSGVSTAIVTVVERPNKDTVKVSFAVSSSVGPQLEQSSVASQITGKKAGEAKQQLETIPGVTRADISLSPFWVFTIPKDSNKISVTVNE